MNRFATAVSLGIFAVSSLRAASAAESVVVQPDASVTNVTSELPRRARVADPWLTRGTVTVQGGVASWSSTMPIPAMFEEANGKANGGSLAVDLYGRRMGFNLALGGAVTENAGAPVEGAEGSRMTAGEIHAAFTAVLWNSGGVFLAVGPGIEGRATALGSTETGNQALTSWQTVVGGGDARARVFIGPRIYLTGAAFCGAAPITGTWQSVDAASTDVVNDGELTDPMVFAGNLSASLRPVEWIALSGGVAVREARFRFEDGASGRERAVRPYIGLELLY